MLNLTGLRQESLVETDAQYEVEVTVEGGEPRCSCPFPKILLNGRKRTMFFDTPMHGKRVGIWVQRQRYRCKSCGRSHYQTVPHMHPKHDMTRRLVDYIQRFGTERTFTAISSEIGVNVETVRRIWREHARAELDRLDTVTPTWMGIDELHIMHGYRGVITNVKERTIVDLLKDRKKETVVRYLAGLPDAHVITHVAMDMWEPYREAVRIALPKATIVVDRFHVSRMASEAMERVRKLLGATLPQKSKLMLMGDRWLLLRNEKDLDATQTILLQSTLGQFPLLRKAWIAKEGFRAIWKLPTRVEAEQAYTDWLTALDPDVAPAFGDLVRAMGNWRTEIFNYFEHRITNAYTESFNSIARKMDRMGRGYSFEVLRAKLLLRYGCHKDEKPPARFVRTGTSSDHLSMSRTASFMIAEPPPPPRHLGVDMGSLAVWLDSLPETP